MCVGDLEIEEEEEKREEKGKEDSLENENLDQSLSRLDLCVCV